METKAWKQVMVRIKPAVIDELLMKYPIRKCTDGTQRRRTEAAEFGTTVYTSPIDDWVLNFISRPTGSWQSSYTCMTSLRETTMVLSDLTEKMRSLHQYSACDVRVCSSASGFSLKSRPYLLDFRCSPHVREDQGWGTSVGRLFS